MGKTVCGKMSITMPTARSPCLSLEKENWYLLLPGPGVNGECFFVRAMTMGWGTWRNKQMIQRLDSNNREILPKLLVMAREDHCSVYRSIYCIVKDPKAS